MVVLLDFAVIILILLITGIAAGFFAGLLGIGGGFLMVPVQYLLLIETGIDPTFAIRIAIGTSLAVVFPVSCSAAWAHQKHQPSTGRQQYQSGLQDSEEDLPAGPLLHTYRLRSSNPSLEQWSLLPLSE